MSVALFSAGRATPRIKNKREVWTLWFRVRVHTQQLDIRGEWKPEEGEGQPSGSKGPSGARRKRIRFRRGTRGGRKGARLVKRSKPTTTRRRNEKRPLIEPGSGARARHFVAGFNKSVEANIRVATQCLDIKRRGEERRQKGQKPFLPPKAEEGLARRQTRLRKSSDFWGKAWAKVFGVSPAEGRRCWRDRLFERSLVVRRDGIIFDDASSVMNLTDIITKEAGKQQHYTQICWCPRCGQEGSKPFYSEEGRPPVRAKVWCPDCLNRPAKKWVDPCRCRRKHMGSCESHGDGRRTRG